MEKVRPVIFKWRQFEPAMIVASVNWYLRYSLSLRDVEELLIERGVSADHTTVWRWVQRYASELEKRLRPRLKPTNKSWRVDETYIRVKGKWTYLYRAVDSTGGHQRFSACAPRYRGGPKVFPQGFCAVGDPPASDQRGQNPLLSPPGGGAIKRKNVPSFQLLFIGGAPGRVFVKRCHCTCERRSVCAEILFIDGAVRRDDEGHHTR